MADRTFTLDEAKSLLPVLESLLRTAINAKKIIEVELSADEKAALKKSADGVKQTMAAVTL